MTVITTFQDHFYSQIENINATNPRLVSPINSDTLVITLTTGVVFPDATIPTKAFTAVIRNADTGYPENIFVPASALSVDGKTITLTATTQRGLPLSASATDTIDFLSGTTARASAHPANSEFRLNISPLTIAMISECLQGNLSYGVKHSKRETFDNTVPSASPVYATYAAGNSAIASPANGDGFYATAEGHFYDYQGGAWSARVSGVNPNGSTTVAGKFEEATVAEQGTASATGDSGARLIPANENLVKTSSGAGDENKIAILNASGKFADGFQNITVANVTDLTDGGVTTLHTHAGSKFGGTGADGVVTDAALTITGSDNTYIVKNYSSWTAGSVSRTATISPVGCITHIKISGNANFTNWALNWAGKGMANGGGSSSLSFYNVAPSAGQNGSGESGGGGGGGGGASIKGNGNGGSNGSGGAGAGSAGSGGVQQIMQLSSLTQIFKDFKLFVGQGGNGGGNGSATNGGGAGGAGGGGGGVVIFEVVGNVTFSSATATVAGANGSNGSNGSGGSGAGGGGGGGGGGGQFILLYNGTLTGTLTPTITGGSGGAGGTAGGGNGGGGGNGLAGLYLIEANTTFA
jgi:hypothetical protein